MQEGTVGKSLHTLESDCVLKSLKLNQINREHTALESRCPRFPTRTHSIASSLKERQGAATQLPEVCYWWLVKRKSIQIGFWVKYS